MKYTTCFTGVVLALALFAGAGSVHGTLIAYDGFDYETGGLHGAGSADDDGWEGAWGGETGAGEAQIVQHAMSYVNGDVRVNNNASGHALQSAQGRYNNMATRFFTVNEAPDDLYMSMLFQVVTDDPTENSWFISPLIWDSTDGAHQRPGVVQLLGGGVQARSGNGVDEWNSSTVSGLDARDGNVHLFVLRIRKINDSETYNRVELYVNPDSLDAPPASPSAFVNLDTTKELLDMLSIRTHDIGGYAGSDQYIGELRIGTSWEAVVIPEPSVVGLLGIGGVLALLKRRFR